MTTADFCIQTQGSRRKHLIGKVSERIVLAARRDCYSALAPLASSSVSAPSMACADVALAALRCHVSVHSQCVACGTPRYEDVCLALHCLSWER